VKRSAHEIRTSHCGKLPAPEGAEDLPPRLAGGAPIGAPEMSARVEPMMAGVIRRQVELGIDCIGDGEYWSGLGFSYYSRLMSGLSLRPLQPGEVAVPREDARERRAFPGFYRAAEAGGSLFFVPGSRPAPRARERMVVNGPIASKGIEPVTRQLAAFKEAIVRAQVTVDEAFVPVLSPTWFEHRVRNEHYRTDQDYLFALADLFREQYRAVIDAGFILQIDDPTIVSSWDMVQPQLGLAQYRDFAKLRVAALNRALEGLPEDKIRFHFCWGSWHTPHTGDIPLQDIIDIVLDVRARTFSFEAASARHEHEWQVWRDAKLPAGTMLMPGVVSHATNAIEHPALVAERLVRYAGIVGRENVVAGVDCGLGDRVHGEIAWAKLASLVEGARIASKSLWRG
jgi:5-methyltetrahydropteroyltriglutamate--homocysteine methyltransferase